jgi:hypothetical protein
MWIVILMACGSLPPWMFPFGDDAVAPEAVAGALEEAPVEPDELAEATPEEPIEEEAVEEIEVEPSKIAKMDEPKTPAKVPTPDVERRREELAAQSKLLLKIIGTTGETNGDTIENLWSYEDSLHDIDRALSEVSGVTVAASGGGLSGGNVGGSGSVADIGHLYGGGDMADIDLASTVKVKMMASRGHTGSEGRPDVDKVVRRYTGQLTYCAEQTAKKDGAAAEGKVEAVLDVKGGRVVEAIIAANSSGSASMADCFSGKIRRWRFPAEVEGKFTLPFLVSAH